jgi:hypothetical protein
VPSQNQGALLMQTTMRMKEDNDYGRRYYLGIYELDHRDNRET